MKKITHKIYLMLLIFILIISIIPYIFIINASVTTENWSLIKANSGWDTSSYGTVYYYYEYTCFSGYVQDGYREWYAIF